MAQKAMSLALTWECASQKSLFNFYDISGATDTAEGSCLPLALLTEPPSLQPNMPQRTTSRAGKVDTFSLLVHLCAEKQCLAQSTTHDLSHHLPQPRVISQNPRHVCCPCRALVSCTLYHCTSYLSQKAFGQVNSRCVLMYCHLKAGL